MVGPSCQTEAEEPRGDVAHHWAIGFAVTDSQWQAASQIQRYTVLLAPRSLSSLASHAALGLPLLLVLVTRLQAVLVSVLRSVARIFSLIRMGIRSCVLQV